MTKKVKHQMTMTVYEDNSVDFQFQGIENWGAGRMQTQAARGVRALKTEQRLLQQKKVREEHKAKLAREADEASKEAELKAKHEAAKSRSDYLLSKAEFEEITAEEMAELKVLAKDFPTLNINEEVLNNEHDNERQDEGTGNGDKAAEGDSGDSGQAAEGESGVPEANDGNDEADAGVNDQLSSDGSEQLQGDTGK